MNGRKLMIIGGVVLAIFTGVLWWTQTRAYYETVEGLTEITVDGRTIAVSDYTGIDATSSPIKMRACLTVDPASLADATPATKPTPLIAPGWFDCFDAGALTKALEAGEATAYLAAEEEADGVDRLIAVYPDGRAFIWQQLNAKYAE
jgi:hypothetical protein